MVNNKDKEDILDALEGRKLLKCDKCGCRVFNRTSEVKVHLIKEDDSITDDHITNEEYNYQCNECKKYIIGEELI